MQLRDASIIVLEEGEKILGQVMLIARRQCADDTEVHRRVARLLRIVEHHEDVAGMHVGVKEIVPKRLREKNLHAVLGQALDVSAAPLQLLDVIDEHTLNALHHHHVVARVIPINLGHVQAAVSR